MALKVFDAKTGELKRVEHEGMCIRYPKFTYHIDLANHLEYEFYDDPKKYAHILLSDDNAGSFRLNLYNDPENDEFHVFEPDASYDVFNRWMAIRRKQIREHAVKNAKLYYQITEEGSKTLNKYFKNAYAKAYTKAYAEKASYISVKIAWNEV